VRNSRTVFYTRIVVVLCCLLIAALTMSAQATSGSISGTVKDKQGAVVPAAKVTLLDQDRGASREQSSSPEGGFMFQSVPPSTYTITVEVPGFKKWEKKDVKLYATDRLGVNDIVLEVGQVTDSVTVEASTVQLQTESAEKSGTITGQMYQDLAVRDRSFGSLMMTIPGVTNASQYTANVNGLRDDANSFKVDGITNVDSGVQQCCGSWVNMDLIAEMKVVTNNATADMGRMSGAQINVVTKSGSKEFHGNFYWFRRHEEFNANNWSNNQNGTLRGRDRNTQAGFTLGGPVFIPKHFNTSKDKLFFFASDELWRAYSPSTGNRTMPTAAERVGDFSASVRTNNTAVIVLDPANRDPVTGKAIQFPNNFIPANRRNADMVKLMNLFPLPTLSGTRQDYSYNYQFNAPSNQNDVLLQSYRLDYNLSDRWRIYGRLLTDRRDQLTPVGGSSMTNFAYPVGAATNPSFMSRGALGAFWLYRTSSTGVLNVTTIINPTTTNELVAGWALSRIPNYILDAQYTETNLNLSYQALYPQTVMGNFAPQIGFGGNDLANAPSLGTNSPYIYFNTNFNLSDNVSKVMTRHTLKAGVMFELDRKDQDGGGSWAGNFNFGRDVNNNPNETDYQFSNMLMGNFNTYSQNARRVEGRYIYKDIEWYAQDTWKVRPNLTLDLGLRFYYMGPGYDAHGQMSTFDPSLFKQNQKVSLYQYACAVPTSGACASANIRAQDPTTGLLYPSTLVGNVVTSSGNINNGFIATGKNLIQDPGITFAPRIGVAYQPGFLPKTVIRFGGGMFYDRYMGNVVYGGIGLPPTIRNPTLYYSNESAVASALQVISPAGGGGLGWVGTKKPPQTFNYNFSIQRELPYGIMGEIGYVGSVTRHLIYRMQINAPGFGTAWQPWAQNYVTNAVVKYDGSTSLPVNFWRPYTGVSGLDLYANGANANYNGLQLKAEKRMSRKLSFTFAYTWSRSMGICDNVYSTVNLFDYMKYNYGRTGYDRTQVMTASYIYYLPKFGKNGNFLDHPGVRLVLNDWQLSGLMAGMTGTRAQFGTPGFNQDGSNITQRWTGSNDYGPRALIVGDWRSSVTNEYNQFNTAAIQMPLGGPANPSVGLESGTGYWSNPATFLSSIQTTMMKNIPFSKDGRRFVQLRLETYNTLNHHDWTGRNMTPQFYSPVDMRLSNLPAGISTLTNPSNGTSINGGRFGYGALTGANSPRTMQMALKVYF
jgi:hypothetical protein